MEEGGTVSGSSLIHTCDPARLTPSTILIELQRQAGELGGVPQSGCTWRIPRGARMVPCQRGFQVDYDESHVAGKDRLRPCGNLPETCRKPVYGNAGSHQGFPGQAL